MPEKEEIVVFDSGVGGLSVLNKMRTFLPNERYLYYGDISNAPYGKRETEEIQRLTLAAVEPLISEQTKALVIACNTATSAAIGLLRQKYTGFPVIGIEPALKPAVEYTRTAVKERMPCILVMGTDRTLLLPKYRALRSRFEKQARIVELPATGLVPLVESGKRGGSEVEALLRSLKASVAQFAFDAIVLGCTHFPFVSEAILRVFGPVPQFDGGDGVARQTARLLRGREARDKGGEVLFLSSATTASEKERYETLCRALTERKETEVK